MSQWYVKNVQGEVEGPLGEDAVVAGLNQKLISRKTIVNRVGSRDWVPIEDHPPFRDAARARTALGAAAAAASSAAGEPEQAATPLVAVKSPTSMAWGNRWVVLTAVSGALALVTMAGLLGVAIHGSVVARAELAELKTRQSELVARTDGIRSDIAATQSATPVDMSELVHQCFGFNAHATCTFTNARAEPVRACWRARISLKAAPGVQLDSLVACTGRIPPWSTTATSVPWLRGEADDVCKSKNIYGHEHLDWSVCNVEFMPVKLGDAK